MNANHIDIEDVRGKAFDVAGVFFLIMLALLIFVTFLLSSRIEDCKRRLESHPPVLSLKCGRCVTFEESQRADCLAVVADLVADRKIIVVDASGEKVQVHKIEPSRFEVRRRSR